MKQKLTLLVLCLCCIAGRFANAQDLMYLKNTKSPIQVKIHEIGLDEVKYKPWGDTLMPVLVIPRISVSKLVLENGSVFEFKNEGMTDPANYTDQHNNAIKFSFLSPLYENISFSYERSIKPGRSFEVGLGIIGPGVDFGSDPRGMYLRLGYKFITAPDFYLRGMKYAHILKGGYIKPEIAFGGYGIDRYIYSPYSYYGSSTSTYRRNVTFGGVLVNFGKQWVMDDVFVFDMYFGIGYGFTKYDKESNSRYNYYDDQPEVYQYAFLGGIKEFPIALTAGLKMGFLFGKQPEKVMPGK